MYPKYYPEESREEPQIGEGEESLLFTLWDQDHAVDDIVDTIGEVHVIVGAANHVDNESNFLAGEAATTYTSMA